MKINGHISLEHCRISLFSAFFHALVDYIFIFVKNCFYIKKKFEKINENKSDECGD